jgi:hypothetical protein
MKGSRSEVAPAAPRAREVAVTRGAVAQRSIFLVFLVTLAIQGIAAGRALIDSKTARRSLRNRLLLLEALLALAVSSLIVAVLPFSVIIETTGWFAPSKSLVPEQRVDIHQRVRWAVISVARWIPWPVRCFQQGLAAHWMLRRRNVPAQLYYGGAQDPGHGARAHVWICDDDVAIIGGQRAWRFGLLAIFPG